ncbi:MAG TPA: hypothetical protein VGD72_09530 [Mycobacteriales bacterium]|jgi:hypothetical protein
MSEVRSGFDEARAIADAVLLEGYVLYPYRASAQKNRMRFQFGVLTPRPVAESGTGETWFSQTECLVEMDEPAAAAPDALHLRTRFLQLQARTVEEATPDGYREVDVLEVDDTPIPAWDEGVERQVDVTTSLTELLEGRDVEFTIAAGEDVEDVTAPDGTAVGRIRRRRQELTGVLRLAAQRFGGPYPLVKLHLRVENHTPWADPSAPRNEAMRGSLLAAHTLLRVTGGKFVSLLDSPWWASPAVAECENLHTFPVLVCQDSDDVMLSSPIILYDRPAIAPESQGDMFDGLENDEILTLRTMALTDEEKRQVRGTDPRGAAMLDRVDGLPPEIMERLHGAIRELRTVSSEPQEEPLPWWEPGSDDPASPETDLVYVGGVGVRKGWRVRLHPGRGADAQDMFLEGRLADVDHVRVDVDGQRYLAVTLADDQNADLHAATGRFLYFSSEEIEPLEPPVVDP